MVFCPYLTLGDGLRLCCVDALFCALRFTAFVCQGRMVFCPYLTLGDGLPLCCEGHNILCPSFDSIRMSGQNGILPLQYCDKGFGHFWRGSITLLCPWLHIVLSFSALIELARLGLTELASLIFSTDLFLFLNRLLSPGLLDMVPGIVGLADNQFHV